MTLRQKSNPILRNPVNEKISGKLDPNSGILPKSQDNPAGSSESFINEDTLLGNNSLAVEMNRRNLQHRTCLNPSDVQYWVANSSSHIDTVLDSNPCSQTSYGSDLSSSIVAPNIPGPVSVSQSNFSHISLQCSAQIPGVQGMNLNYDDISESVVASQMNTALGISNTFGLDENMNFLGEQYQSDTWSYPTPGDDDINFANSMATHSMMVSNEQDVCPQWSSEPFEPGAEISDGSIPCTSQSIDWSPILAVDPSISSSYSQSSLLAYQPNTPLSPCAQEDSWYHGQCGILDVESGLCSTFSLGEPVQFSPSPEFVDNQSTRFVKKCLRREVPWLTKSCSTLKPIQVFQRTPVSAIDCWSQDEVAKQGYMAPYPARRKSSEGETTTAREHPYYHVGPGKDNLYHCPFAGDEDCNHKPEKLKCNYE